MTTAPEHHRPFNLDHAKAGAPYGTLSGAPVEILKWDMHSNNSPILALIGARQDVVMYTKEGKSVNAAHLCMLPLFMLEGKPAFMGDKIAMKGSGGTATLDDPRVNHLMLDSWTWPKPAKKYPKTRMTGESIIHLYMSIGSGPGGIDDFVGVADAAIARAIDDGDVFTREQLEKVASTFLREVLNEMVTGTTIHKRLCKVDICEWVERAIK